MTVLFRLAWLALGAAMCAAILFLTGAPVLQKIMQNNEIVFPENPDVLRAGAVSNRYPLVYRKIPVGEQTAWPGALTSAGDLVVLVNRKGAFHVLTGGQFVPAALPDFAVPAATADSKITLSAVFDAVMRRDGDTYEMFLSFAYEGPQAGCTSLAVARATLTGAMLAPGTATAGADWTTIFTSTPCIDGAGNQISLLGGGAMLLEAQTLILAVGTFSLELANTRERVAFLHSDLNPYGKIVRIDLETNIHTIVSKGHRDPVGLARDTEGGLWAVEHGPRGGDELNLVRQGGNYGWPILTFGSAYGLYRWTDDPDPDKIDQFDVPGFVWVPSIAPSSMLRVDSPAFPAWKGDLLVSSLKGGRLIRVRLHKGQVIFAEPILVGARVRDLVQTEAGEILVLLDRLPLVLRIENGIGRVDPKTPATGFCVACHQLVPSDARPATGPSLVGVIGRRVAADQSYPFTDALRSLGGTWTVPRIIEFVKTPQRLAFGSSHPDMDLANFRMKAFLEWMEANGG